MALLVSAEISGDGGGQCGKEQLRADPVHQARIVQIDPQILLHPGHRKGDAGVLQFLAQQIQGIGRGDIDFDIGLRIQHEPFDPVGGAAHRVQRSVPEILGIGETQR